MSKKNSGLKSLNRRNFIKNTASIAIAGFGSSLFVSTANASEYHPNWQVLGRDKNDRKFWRKVQKQFLLDKKQPI